MNYTIEQTTGIKTKAWTICKDGVEFIRSLSFKKAKSMVEELNDLQTRLSGKPEQHPCVEDITSDKAAARNAVQTKRRTERAMARAAARRTQEEATAQASRASEQSSRAAAQTQQQPHCITDKLIDHPKSPERRDGSAASEASQANKSNTLQLKQQMIKVVSQPCDDDDDNW